VKITQKGPNSVKVSRPAASPETPPVPPQLTPAAASTPLDSVELSALASSGVSAGEAPFNAEQVERIKQAIRQGEFTVDAGIVADKLLEIERALVRQS
jgi:flagellar biosynthesis anti-sigma factor FlgM